LLDPQPLRLAEIYFEVAGVGGVKQSVRCGRECRRQQSVICRGFVLPTSGDLQQWNDGLATNPLYFQSIANKSKN
jgi:hypothetical protein